MASRKPANRSRSGRASPTASKRKIATSKSRSGAKNQPRPKAKAKAKAGTKTATKRKSAANRRKPSAQRGKQATAERPILAFVGEAARWTVAPLCTPGFRAGARMIIGAAMLPLGWITFETFLRSFGHAALEGAFWKTSELWFFCIGVVMWLVLFYGLRGRPMLWAYVAGHELTHAIFVLLSGGNVKGVHISAEGGHVLTNKNNLLIVLSPYFVPFYTLVTIGLWWIVSKFAPDWTAERAQLLFAAIGFTWTFHVSFTIWMITREQPDLHHYGRVFSIALIILVNTVLISALLIIASPDVTWHQFGHAWWINFTTFGSRLAESVREMATFFF